MHIVFSSSDDPSALLDEVRRLMLQPCPHCRACGHLLSHGSRMGYVAGK